LPLLPPRAVPVAGTWGSVLRHAIVNNNVDATSADRAKAKRNAAMEITSG
jgi:hypothetical protein